MPKIASLTKEQKDRFPEFVKKWTDIGLCTDPANREESELAIKEIYKECRREGKGFKRKSKGFCKLFPKSSTRH